MDKKLTVSGKVATFGMTVSGGDLPDGYKAEIDVEIDYMGMSEEALITICSGGQSLRVALQGQLRKKRVPELNSIVSTGLKVKATDIVKGDTTKPTDKLLALPREDFIEVITYEYGITVEQAEKIYDTKHGITA